MAFAKMHITVWIDRNKKEEDSARSLGLGLLQDLTRDGKVVGWRIEGTEESE